MSKRGAEFQGGEERYGAYNGAQTVAMSSNVFQRATAAQLANRKIASAKSNARSARNSRANTPTANPFGGGQVQSINPSQTMSFQPGSNDFTFSAGASAPPAPSFGQNGSTGTAPPTMFGAAGTQQSQQNGPSNPFGGAGTSFGNSVFGGSNAAQPQQNGFGSSANVFGQAKSTSNDFTPAFGGFGQSQAAGASTTPSTSFGGFGQSQEADTASSFTGFGNPQPQQNGSAAAGSAPTSFGSTATQSQPKPTASRGGFGSSQPQENSQNGANTSFGGFGQPQPNSTSNIFSASKPAEAAKTTADIFKGFSSQSTAQAQPNGDKPNNVFGGTPTPDPPPQSSNSNLFGQQNAEKPSLFAPSTSSPNLGNSILSGLNSTRASEVKAGMFTQDKTAAPTPKPAGSNMFSFAQQNGGTTPPIVDNQTPKPANIFSSASQTQANGVKPNVFGSNPTPGPAASTPASNPFSFAKASEQTQSPNAGSAFAWGKSPPPDTSMTTPGSTPQKAQNPSQMQLFGTSAPAQGSTSTANEDEQPKASLFSPATTSNKPLATPTKQTEGSAEVVNTSKSLFERIGPTNSAQPTSSAWNNPAPPRSTEPLSQPPSASVKTSSDVSSATHKKSMGESISLSEQEAFRTLNEGFKAHLAGQNPLSDWSSILQYYLQQAAKIRQQTAPTFDSAASGGTGASSAVKPLAQKLASARALQGNATTQTPQASSSAFSFGRTATEATPAKTANSFEPPNTAPNKARKRSADDDVRQPPATEKRAPTYAPLPNTASNASKLFESIYEDTAKSSGTAKDRADSPGFGPPSSMLEQAREAKQKSQDAASTGFKPSGFTPAIASAASGASASGFKPSTPASSGMPTFAAPASGAGGFLAAFGQKATAQAETDKQKRKAEDFDSEDDDEAVWEAKDKAAQEEKKRKIEDAAKNATGFSFTGSNTSRPAFGTTATAATPKPTGASLFDLSAPRDPPATEPPKTSLFNFGNSATADASRPASSNLSSNLNGATGKALTTADKTLGEKEQGSGDNTWKPETPIKFGGTSASNLSFTPATAPPKPPFGSLFGPAGSDKAAASGLLSIPGAKPSLNFNFGGTPSLGNSRATTPGVTTDGEGASTAGEKENADDEGARDEQVEDQTGLREEEKEHEDLLLSLKIAKAQKFIDEKKDAETGELKPGWIERGKGPLYILKHRDTGSKRVILKLPPFGKPVMNFAPIKGGAYVLASAKAIKGPFVDHLDKRDAETGKVSTWLIQVGKPEDAKEIHRLLSEN